MEDQPISDHKEIGFQKITIFDQQIGSGSYGSVHKAVCDNLLCAAKRIHTSLVGPANATPSERNHRIPIRRFEAEFKFLQELRHPNIVQCLGMYHESSSQQSVLLMELMDESLTDFLDRAADPIPYHTQVNICFDIIRALSYLHVNEIVHRDLSSNNILLSGKPCKAKLSDFGMVKFLNFRMSHVTQNVSNTAMPGTEVYMPPEAFDGQNEFKDKGDIFSFGVILVQIITRKFPQPGGRFEYMQISDRQVRTCIPEVKRRENHLSLIQLGHPLLPIAHSCLEDVEDNRPTASDLCPPFESILETVQYKKSKEIEDTPSIPAVVENRCTAVPSVSLRTTEDKGVNTDLPESEDVETDSKPGLVKSYKLKRRNTYLQKNFTKMEQTIQEKDNEIDALHIQRDIKQKSLEHLNRAKTELQEKLQQKEMALDSLSQELASLESANAVLQEQLHEKSELITKYQQQLKEMELESDSKTKQINDQHSQEIAEKDLRIKQQQERIDELELEKSLQVSVSKKKKIIGKGKKMKAQLQSTTNANEDKVQHPNSTQAASTATGSVHCPSEERSVKFHTQHKLLTQSDNDEESLQSNDSLNEIAHKSKKSSRHLPRLFKKKKKKSPPVSDSPVANFSEPSQPSQMDTSSDKKKSQVASPHKAASSPSDFHSISTGKVPQKQLQRREMKALKEMEESSARSLKILQDTEHLGIATSEELNLQSEKLDRIEQRLDAVDEGISTGRDSVKKVKSRFHWKSSKKPAAAEKILRPTVPSAKPSEDTTTTSSLQQYPSTGSEIVDSNLDKMSEMLTNVKKIAIEQSAMLDRQNERCEQINLKSERNRLNFREINADLKKQL